MNLIFRLNYHTIPGQSLWLKYSSVLDEKGVRFDQIVPLNWVNDQQWEANVAVRGAGKFRIEYHYQLRGSNGVAIDEWNIPRGIDVDLAAHDVLLMLDSWCSAGTVDYAYNTNALRVVLPARGPFVEPSTPPEANHTFRITMAAVPVGQVPCIIGSVQEIGNWGWHSAVPMEETAFNVWEKNLYLPMDWAIEYKYGLYDHALKCVVSMELGDNRKLPAHTHAARQLTRVSDESYRRGTSHQFRGSGVAIPVFSLRSESSLGVGEFADLKPLADWAKSLGLKLIQILPINDTTSSHDWTDSYPYSAISVFALHPIYLRIDDLKYDMPASFAKEVSQKCKLLNQLSQVDYEAVMKLKSKLTRQIFQKHISWITRNRDFTSFVSSNASWAIPYAVFCVKRDQFGTADFTQWLEWAIYDEARVMELTNPSHPEWPEIAYHLWLQFELDRQLADAVNHLHHCGLALKGDLPIGIDRQSVEAWSAPHLFKMEAQTGAPPDAFALKGQNWGFPTYNWEAMRSDDYAWWRSRFAQLSRYFDAYRIDHILGFFRIWQVPYDQVEGIMGYFDPALPIQLDEFQQLRIPFNYNRFCLPYLREHLLLKRFGEATEYVKYYYLNDCGEGHYQLREEVSTQRRILECFKDSPDDPLKELLMDCVSEVLFFEVPGSNGTQFHPRYSLQTTDSFLELDEPTRWRLHELYNYYFYRRQEDFWEARGYEKLPAMRQASQMLLCGEDLGMVPACVPGVMQELGILSLEIQRMPKTMGVEFFDPRNAPYLSVVSPSTHDMPTLRAWWQEDFATASKAAWQLLGISDPGTELSTDIAGQILWQHLHSPAMWAVFPLQDLLAMDETLRHPHPEEERINVPAIMPYYWRYRMHIGLDQLAEAEEFNRKFSTMIQASGR